MANENEECTMKKLFDSLYPTDVMFEYNSTSADGKYIKVILYNDLWLEIYSYSKENYLVVKYTRNSVTNTRVERFYWSFKELQEYLRINYEG